MSASDAAPARPAESSRARGRRVVSAGAPAAVGAGLETFRRGGNAFDAAIAACLVEGIALPMKCGLGGDLVALARTEAGPIRALISVGPGVAALARGGRLTKVGPCSVGVPGAPDGYAALAGLGRLGLGALVEPAVRAAEEGVEWTRTAVQLTEEAEPLLRSHNRDTSFLPEGRLPRLGERLRLPRLAALLSRFAQRGSELFFGADGEILAGCVEAAGGLLRAGDLRLRPAHWSDADGLELHGGARLKVTPAPTHGPILARAVELAHLGGMDSVKAAARSHAELGRAGAAPSAGGTSVVTAADGEGGAVVVVHSNSFPHFGSGLVVGEWDLVLNNRPGRGFDLEAPAEAANAPRAGRIPETTLHAWAVESGDATLFGATPGGDNQMPWNLQTVLACLEDGADLGLIVAEPRWGFGAAGHIVCEANHALTGGEGVEVAPPLSLRSAEQVLCVPEKDSEAEVAADPRTGARAGAI